jgi:hypothetical protein
MEKRTVFVQMECTASGEAFIKFDKQIVDGEKVVASRFHRIAVEPGQSLDAVLADVHQHISTEEMGGYPPLSAADVSRVRAVIDVDHTPERIATFRARRQKAEAEATALFRSAAKHTP